MFMKNVFMPVRYFIFFLFCIITSLNAQESQDRVKGNLIQYNQNGYWCWFQDERAVVDTSAGKLIVGSITTETGTGGQPVKADLPARLFDLKTRTTETYLLNDELGGDDHNAPSFLVLPNGNYLAMYAGHNYDNLSFYRIFNGSNWETEHSFDWNTMPGGTDFQTTYSNLYYLSAEDRIYNFSRNHRRSPNIMISNDLGETWSYGGLLTNPDTSIGYVNGYFKYCSNNYDRIDFVCTEHHPADYNTSIYHGYIKDGKSYKSDGTQMDDNIFDQSAPSPEDFTQVFVANTVMQGVIMKRCWTIDLQRYEDGTMATIFNARANDSEMDHRYIYAFYDGESWTSKYLCKAGPRLDPYPDYIGLGAMHPNDTNTIFISTSFDPINGEDLTVYEIYKGITTNHGETWTWIPITQKSLRDNIRPIVVNWDEQHTALLWLRGIFSYAEGSDMAVVGIIEDEDEIVDRMTYIDATSSNTFLADGSQLVTTGPSSDKGPADNQWHLRTGYANGNTLFTTSENNGEDAPAIKTVLSLPEQGTYDIWINFWAHPDCDWRIKAGFSESEMQLYRQMACKQVENGDHNTTLVLSTTIILLLYQGYLGRVSIASDSTLDIFIDDYAVAVGTENTLVANVNRTWYDGISYAKVDIQSTSIQIKKNVLAERFSLFQNYPNPFNPTTTISYTVQVNGHSPIQNVDLSIYNTLGQKVATLVNKKQPAGSYKVKFDGSNLASGIYFYCLKTNRGLLLTKKLLLLK